MLDIVLINPRFEVSYWGMEHALPLLGKRANLPVAALPLLAALTPIDHSVTIMDENVEPIDFARCARANIVGLTGMSVQKWRMKEIATKLQSLDVFIVIGGPYVTVEEDYFGDLPDVIFIGEAETTWPQFLKDFQASVHKYRYEQLERTDMSTLPVPRFDLLPMSSYAFGSIQFSRGCPFQCEFCDIIVTFGRRPRIKTSSQILAELDAIRAAGQRIVFIVDDNLIGNKKAIKLVLRDIITWQNYYGFPLIFTTEASIDLADDAELLSLMVQANIVSVFIGIESPNEASLRETKKFQNLRMGGTLLEKVHRIQDAGIEVWCGMILGFDNDDVTIFEIQRKFITDANIITAMVGMLNAIPKTPLHARLAAVGRLRDWSADSTYGTNIVPLQMTSQELTDGYLATMKALYEPDAYFARLEALLIGRRFQTASAMTDYWRRHPSQWLRGQSILLLQLLGLFSMLMAKVPDPHLRRIYRKYLIRLLRVRREPVTIVSYLMKCVLHYHDYTMTKGMLDGTTRIYNSG